MPPRHWLPRRIPPDNILTPKAKHSSKTNNNNKKPNRRTQQQQHDDTGRPWSAHQDGNKDAKSIAGREGQKTQKRTTSIKDPPAAGTNSTHNADDPQVSGVNSTNGTSSRVGCTNSTNNANDPEASGTNSTNGTIDTDTANTNNYDNGANAKKMNNAPPGAQQTTQSQGTTNSDESNTNQSDSKHANNDAPGQKDDENVSYFFTFKFMHTIPHVILCWSLSLIWYIL